MIQSVTIRNFKRLEDVAIALGERIVFADPNNCGKTSAIQTLSMWRLALARWLAGSKSVWTIRKARISKNQGQTQSLLFPKDY